MKLIRIRLRLMAIWYKVVMIISFPIQKGCKSPDIVLIERHEQPANHKHGSHPRMLKCELQANSVANAVLAYERKDAETLRGLTTDRFAGRAASDYLKKLEKQCHTLTKPG